MITIPENYKLIVHIHQFTPIDESLNYIALNERAGQITLFLKFDINRFASTNKPLFIRTSHELHVLRLLRHVREQVNDIKLEPKHLEFWFDNPNDEAMLCIEVTNDGDLASRVPGGFFTQRAAELF